MDIDLNTKLYRALITERNERDVSSLCQNLADDEGPMHVVTIYGDSVLHVALTSVQVELAENLLDMPFDRNLLLTRRNADGNTLLQEAATHDEFLRVAKKLLELQPQLLNMANKNLETPLFSAARYGQMKMFNFLDDELHRRLGDESAKIFRRKKDKNTILHAAIDAEHFDMACWIARKHEYLHDKKNHNRLTALQLLACNPSPFGFRGKGLKGWLIKTFIDSRIKNNNEDEDSSHLHEEKVTPRNYYSVPWNVPWWDEMLRKRRTYNAAVKLANRLIEKDISWAPDKENVKKSAAKKDDESIVVYSKDVVKEIEAKLRKIDADLKKIEAELKENESELNEIEAQLKKTDKYELKKRKDELEKTGTELKKSYQDELNKIKAELMRQTLVQLKKITDKDELKKIEAKEKKAKRHQIPLLLATQTGCFEIVNKILQVHPEAVEYIDKKGRNILHIAVTYRQMEIFDKVKKVMELRMGRLIHRCDSQGNSILHMVGKKIRNEDVVHTQKIQPFFQLQKDLLLFEFIKKKIVTNFYKHTNKEGDTAEEILVRNKEDLRDKSQEWLKRTAESCSIVAVLIATVAFAAAYTVPGGSNPDGSPVLLDQTFFVIFTIGDVLSLTFCLTAVVIFLSILTSSYELQEFKLALPQKLMLGITCLFFSVTMMMLAFSATIILMIHHNEQWSKIALYAVALLPVTVLAIVYMPLFWSLGETFTQSLQQIRPLFPRKDNQSLGEKSNIGADVPVADTTTAENSHSHV